MLIVNGFCREVMQKLLMEFAVEAQKLVGISLSKAASDDRSRLPGYARILQGVGWRGWLRLVVMVAILVVMDYVLLPRPSGGFAMAVAGAWGAAVTVVGVFNSIGEVRWRDFLKGDG